MINVISWISMAGMGIGTAGLVVVLSVFNGFSDLIKGLYDTFDPDIKITAVEGKRFDPEAAGAVATLQGVAHVSHTLEEHVLAKYRDRQAIATVKGVDGNFRHTSEVEQRIAEGAYVLEENGRSYSLVGTSLAYTLGMNLDDIFSTMNLYVPRKGHRAVTVPEQAFTNLVIRPAGVYAIQQDFDSKYILVPLSFARELIGEPRMVSALEVAVAPDADEQAVRDRISAAAGDRFHVRDRVEQHEFLNRIFNSEKWAIYIILGFILLIAAFSIVGSVTTLVIEKKQDIATLLAMGCRLQRVRSIFLIQGTLIACTGGIAGLAIGGFVAWLQQRFGLVRIGNEGEFLVDAYPVALQPSDFLISFLLVAAIGFTLSWLTVGRVIRDERVIPAQV